MREPREHQCLHLGRAGRPQLVTLPAALLMLACSNEPNRGTDTEQNTDDTETSTDESDTATVVPDPDGVTISFSGGTLRLEICTADIIRVLYSEEDVDALAGRESLSAAPKQCDESPQFTLLQETSEAVLTTDTLSVRVDIASRRVSFYNASGDLLLAERDRTVEATEIQEESTYHVRQEWEYREDEAFYGMGQHQDNTFNIKDVPISLVQYNTEIAVPFAVSSRGYGIFWDNTSYTRWGDLTEPVPLVHNEYRASIDFTAEQDGDHIFQAYSSGRVLLTVDDEPVIRHWRQGWLPGKDLAKVSMKAGQTYALSFAHTPDISVDIADLSYLPPREDPTVSLWSNVGDGIDYYFIHGPKTDDVIAGFRKLTGQVPMMPRWAFGLWQSRERYTDADEVLAVLEGFRSRGIPLDTVVQDWQYWEPDSWGSHEFDLSRFPDPEGWIEQIHDEYHARLMVSVWAKFYTNTDTFAALNDAGFIYPLNIEEGIEDFVGYPMTYFDAFNADARDMFWSQIAERLLSLGVDAWWMDATEPETVEGPYESPEIHRELYETHMHPTALGSGARMLNAYSLEVSRAVYEGQRKDSPNQRVFILTRSSFAGQQRYASASWSGDVSNTWTALKKQIPAGLGFSVSGVPYWTSDIGGFAEGPEVSNDAEQWAELNVRWFQFGTFCPLLRVHGQDDRTGPREMWNFDDDTFAALLKFDRLRYRLLPYIYAVAAAVSQEAYTMMRPLVMDFPEDEAVREVGDQYMFGPAFLVSPVTEFEARSREVRLPETAGGWYDFWSGEHTAGDKSITADAPYDEIPIFVRAGAVIPVGPELEYTDQAPADPITLYVYSGADGSFDLYEDEGTTYDYEDGAFATIPLRWSEAEQTLTVGERRGEFPGMLKERTFNVILVSPDAPAEVSAETVPSGSISYNGEETSWTPESL